MTEPRFAPTPKRLALLGRFTLSVGGTPVTVPDASAKVVAALALQRRPLPRQVLAELLWPQRPSGRARANLRSVMWRLPAEAHGVIVERGDHLQLAEDVEVDVDAVIARCRRLLRVPQDKTAWTTEDADAMIWGFGEEDLLVDLLPMWDDDWVLVDRERLHQLRLHSLDALAGALVRSGRLGEAVDAASAALRDEPLRESSARVLMSAYLAGGNVAAARRAYDRYRAILRRELGIEPSPRLGAMLATSDSPTTTG